MTAFRPYLSRLILVRLAALSLIIGGLTVLCAPIPWHQYKADIVITALGTANPTAKGTEVWVLDFGESEGANLLITEGSHDQGWEIRDKHLVSYNHQPASIRWSGRYRGSLKFVLVQHPYSGRVRITFNGIVKDVDLYSSEQVALTLTPSDFSGATARVPVTQLALEYGAIWVIVALLYFLAAFTVSCSWCRSANRDIGVPGATATFAFALPSLLVYAVAHLGFWPAQMSLDSINLWWQLKTHSINDAASAFHTGIAMLASMVYDSPASMIVVNWLLLAAGITLLLRELWQWGVSLPILIITAILFPVFPANFFMATVLWKDVLYAAAFLFTFVSLLKILRVGTDSLASGTALLLGVGLLMIALSRHNGILVVLGISVLVMLVTWKTHNFKPLAMACATALGAVFAAKLVLYPMLGIVGLPERFKAIVPMHVIAAYVVKKPEIVASDERLLSKIMPMKEWRSRYDCQNVSPLFFNDVNNYAALGAHAQELIGIALRYMATDPGVFLEHQLCVTSIEWKIDNKGDFLYTVPAQVEDSTFTRALHLTMEPKSRRVFDTLQSLKAFTESGNWRVVFWGTAPALLISIFVAFFFVIRQGALRYSLLCALPILNALSLVPLIGSPDYRFLYPSIVITLGLIPLFVSASTLRLKVK